MGAITKEQARKAAVEDAKAKKDKQKPGPKTDGDSIKFDRGTTNENILRRLARDHESILAKVESGELTVNQAAIQAGIRKKPTELQEKVAAKEVSLNAAALDL